MIIESLNLCCHIQHANKQKRKKLQVNIIVYLMRNSSSSEISIELVVDQDEVQSREIDLLSKEK